jgi:dihydroorotase
MAISIKGGRIIDPSRNVDETGDLIITGATIGDAASISTSDVTQVIDAAGLWVVPGLIDAHVHLREPGGEHKEDIESGLRAAAAGGFTAVLPMPNTEPPNDQPEITRMMVEKAAFLRGTRVYPVAAATQNRKGGGVAALPALVAAGAVAFSDDGSAVVRDDVMAAALETCRELNVPFSQHAEDPAVVKGGVLHDGDVASALGVPGWPEAGESNIVARDIALAEKLFAHIHCAHISTKTSVALIREAKARGVKVTAEVTPHHLLLTDETARTAGTLAKVNPPLRPKAHVDACVEALADGTLDIIATDHAPHTAEDKAGGFVDAAFGLVGLETAVGLVLRLVEAGKLTPMRMIAAMSTLPARIFNLPGGTLKSKAVADITIIDPNRPHEIDPEQFFSKSRNTPFNSWQVPGKAVMTIVGGEVVFTLLNEI